MALPALTGLSPAGLGVQFPRRTFPVEPFIGRTPCRLRVHGAPRPSLSGQRPHRPHGVDPPPPLPPPACKPTALLTSRPTSKCPVWGLGGSRPWEEAILYPPAPSELREPPAPQPGSYSHWKLSSLSTGLQINATSQCVVASDSPNLTGDRRF